MTLDTNKLAERVAKTLTEIGKEPLMQLACDFRLMAYGPATEFDPSSVKCATMLVSILVDSGILAVFPAAQPAPTKSDLPDVVQSPAESNSAVETINKQHVGFSPAVTDGMRPHQTEDAGGESGTPPLVGREFVDKLESVWKAARNREEVAILRSRVILPDAEVDKAQRTVFCALPLLLFEIRRLWREQPAPSAPDAPLELNVPFTFDPAKCNHSVSFVKSGVVHTFQAAAIDCPHCLRHKLKESAPAKDVLERVGELRAETVKTRERGFLLMLDRHFPELASKAETGREQS